MKATAKTHWHELEIMIAVASLSVFASCTSRELEVCGNVSVDGQALERGTINFRPVDRAANERGGGSAIMDGRFQISKNAAMTAGTYLVNVEGFQKSGRMVADPQRGPVPETVQLHFRSMPLEIDINSENYDRLEVQLELGT